MTETELTELAKQIHDARKPLNRISMQAELVKMALNGDVPTDKALEALDKIITNTKDCSDALSGLMTAFSESPSE